MESSDKKVDFGAFLGFRAELRSKDFRSKLLVCVRTDLQLWLTTPNAQDKLSKREKDIENTKEVEHFGPELNMNPEQYKP